MECEVVELNVQADHVHLVVLILPKVRIADYMGRLKGKTAIRLFSVFRDLRRRPYWGNHFWVEGYCVATVGLDEEKIRQYVKYQDGRNEDRKSFVLANRSTIGTASTGPAPFGGRGFRLLQRLLLNPTPFGHGFFIGP